MSRTSLVLNHLGVKSRLKLCSHSNNRRNVVWRENTSGNIGRYQHLPSPSRVSIAIINLEAYHDAYMGRRGYHTLGTQQSGASQLAS